MINPVQTSVPQADGTDRYVMIEPMLAKEEGAHGIIETGVYKIYKDAFGDETHLFTEPAEFDEGKAELADEANPDYLGKFIFENGTVSQFEGDLLSLAEQAYLAVFIETFVEPDID